jgi:hypothetical protein
LQTQAPGPAGCGPAIWLSSCGLPEDVVEREENKLEEIFREAGFP